MCLYVRKTTINQVLTLFAQANEIIDLDFEGTSPCYVEKIDALKIGEAAMLLGAGRSTKEEAIDSAVGIYLHKKIGDVLNPNDTLVTIYSNGKNTEEAVKMVLDAYEMSSEKIECPNIIIETIK